MPTIVFKATPAMRYYVGYGLTLHDSQKADVTEELAKYLTETFPDNFGGKATDLAEGPAPSDLAETTAPANLAEGGSRKKKK